MRRIHKRWHRKGKTNNHHIVPRSRGGKSVESNLIRMDVNRHCAFHLLFGNLTFREAAAVLMRADRWKEARR